eukprot:NODE_8109_length_1522_cov_9.764158.p1 GENE.NODE_8109_length_1522_cov_9.764158~~NODE_8109_length_1522_cov_9.764158.p1  ORF type:complete len:348 (-),score=77.06 NODE_8109_length_1522_cov_9.764158:261-1304(-)
MVGESLCLVAYAVAVMYWRWEGVHPEDPWPNKSLLFALPNLLEWGGSALLMFSYIFLAPSSVQMLRYSVVIFSCPLTMLCLRRRQHTHHFVGVLFVALGLAIVGLGALMNPPLDEGTSGLVGDSVTGMAMVFLSQLVMAVRCVAESHISKRSRTHALLAIGVEGIAGVVVGIGVVAAAVVARLDNVENFEAQFSESGAVRLTSVLLPISVALFNVSGIAATRRLAPGQRLAADLTSTILIWIGELAVGWNTFFWLTPIGFLSISLGTALYNNVIVVRAWLGAEEIARFDVDPAAQHMDLASLPLESLCSGGIDRAPSRHSAARFLEITGTSRFSSSQVCPDPPADDP